MTLRSDQGRRLRVEDVAQALGVSKTTVSRALSGKGRVSAATRARVFDYVRGQEGFSLPASKRPTHNLTLVIPTPFVQMDLPFMRKCMGGVCQMAAQRGYDVVLCYADQRDTTQLQRQLNEGKTDGVILSRTVSDDPCLDLIRRHRIPSVSVGRPDDPDALQVDNDNVAAAREMTGLLLRMGMRRIAFLGNDLRYVVNRDRLNGYYQALRSLDLVPDEALVRTGLDSAHRRQDALEALLAQRPDCLLCGDDSLALPVLQFLRRRGVRVPQDLRLASLYDSDALSEASPPISAVQFDDTALGAAACRTLLDALAGREPPRRQILGHQVILRESTK